MRILVIVEHDNTRLNDLTLKTLTAAQKINHEVDVLVIGYSCSSVAEHVSRINGVTSVILVDDIAFEHQISENISIVVCELSKGYTHIMCSSSSFGKNILPRVAVTLDVAQISNISSIHKHDIFIRPIYTGNFLQKIRSLDPVKVITIMASAFEANIEEQETVEIKKIEIKNTPNRIVFLESKINESKCPPLQSARVVIAGGRGLKSAENYKSLEKIAIKLNAAIGATRAIVDEGWTTNDKQVGQTGKTVSPELYIALGISGAAQHIAGIKDSKIIVAINKDPLSPIFEIADYGLVADLAEVLPKMDALLT